jgi:hypothetical protein
VDEAADRAGDDDSQQHAQIRSPVVGSKAEEAKWLESIRGAAARSGHRHRPAGDQQIEDKDRKDHKADSERMDLACGRRIIHRGGLCARAAHLARLVCITHLLLPLRTGNAPYAAALFCSVRARRNSIKSGVAIQYN